MVSVASPASFRSSLLRINWVGLYVAVLLALGLGLAFFLAVVQVEGGFLLPLAGFPWPGLVLLLVVAVVAEKYPVRVRPGLEVSAGFLAFFLSAAIAGPLAALVVAVCSQIWRIRRGELLRNLCHASAAGIASGSTGLAYALLLAHFGAPEAETAITVAGIGLAAGLLFQAVNYVLYVPVLWFRRGLLSSLELRGVCARNAVA
jgi:hypothetical protein